MTVIYVHPHTPTVHKCIIPLSVPALINRLDCSCRGYYADEINDINFNEIKIVIIDIHWYLSLFGAIKLIDHIKSINSTVVIIAGGLTATIFAKVLIDTTKLDYVIRGDGEIPLPRLVSSILNQCSDIKLIPNLVGKNIVTPWTYALCASDLDENNYYDIDFFPSYKRDVENIHRKSLWIPSIYPFIVPFRGCPIVCPNCAGGTREQQKLFRRTAVKRSWLKIKNDLTLLSANNNIRFLNIYLDFVSLLPSEDVKLILSEKFKLNIMYEFTRNPNQELLSLLLDSFDGGIICVEVDTHHSNSKKFDTFENIVTTIKTIQKNKKYLPILYYVKRYMDEDRDYRHLVKQIIKETRCGLRRADVCWDGAPSYSEDGDGTPEEYLKYYNQSKGRKYRIINILGRYALLLDSFFPHLSFFLRKMLFRFIV